MLDVFWVFVAVAFEPVPEPLVPAPAADVFCDEVVLLVEPFWPVVLAPPLVLLAEPLLLTEVLVPLLWPELVLPPLLALPVEALVPPEFAAEVVVVAPWAETLPLVLVEAELL